MQPESRSAHFGPFKLTFASRRLWKGGVSVPLGGRALELLVALVERPGEVLTRQELMASAWPGIFVEEANLRVQMTALRRVLSDGQEGISYIANVARRGYSFIADITFADGSDTDSSQPADIRQNLPLNLTPVLGRETVVSDIASELGRHRFVSVVGPGGVGKTTVAVDVARFRLTDPDNPPAAVVLVELAQVTDPGQVASAVSSTIGITLGRDVPSLAEPLPLENVLLVLDNCEHIADAAAAVAETVLSRNSGLRLLTTSREPLRARGEHVFRLAGLELPPSGGGMAAVLASPAIRLFMDRAVASLGSFSPSEEDLRAIAAMCQRLDGMPLAIELAAGRVDTFGIRGLSQRLDDVLHVLVAGRRTALPRHQTLQATLNWSFDNLTAGEQASLARLSVFSGLFSLEAAGAVAAIEQATWEVVEDLSNLVSKSLVTADFSQTLPRYRLLEVTRAYALGKLRERDEAERLSRRHAAHMQKLMAEAEREWPQADPASWLATYASEVDNVRAALDWCFGPGGDRQIGAALTISSAVLWFQLSLVAECRLRFERALSSLREEAELDPTREVAMLTTFATALTYTIGPGREASDALAVAARLARESDDIDLRLRVTWAIWLVALCSGHYGDALALSEDFVRLARGGQLEGDRANEIIGARLHGVSLMYLGRVTEAKVALDDALAGVLSSNQIVRMQYDQELTARAYYSMTLYLMGEQDAASSLAARNVADAGARGHATTFALSLVDSGLPIAYYCGERDIFTERLETLRDVSGRYAFGPWRAWYECFRGSLCLSRSEFAEAEVQLAKGLIMLEKTGWPVRRAMFVCHRAKALLGLGRREEGVVSLDAAITMCRRDGEFWILPELLRVRALGFAPDQARAAEGYLVQGWDMSMALGLRSWSLRTASTALGLFPASTAWRSHLHELVATLAEGQTKPDYIAAVALLRSDAVSRQADQSTI